MGRLENLLKQYNGLAEEYIASTTNKLDTMMKGISEIKRSYTRILDDLLDTLARASMKYDKREDRLKVTISVLPKIPFVRPAISSAQLYVPEAIKEEVSKKAANEKWHFGVDLHVLHIPQILERLYLIEHGYDDYVSSSLLQREHS